MSVEIETYEENVKTLATLINGKGAQIIQQLLDETRLQRNKWLLDEISIRQILDTYPCFKNSKWVSICMFKKIILMFQCYAAAL